LKIDLSNVQGLYKSTDNGNTWTQNLFPANNNIVSVAVNGYNIFAGTQLNGVYRSTDNGVTFTQVFWGGTIRDSRMAVNGNTVLSGGSQYNGVYRSTNNGSNWTQTPLNNEFVKCISNDSSLFLAGVLDHGVYYSGSNGAYWTHTFLGNKTVYSVAIKGYVFFAGAGDSGVYKSTDMGYLWVKTSLNTGRITALMFSGNNLIAGTGNGDIFISSNFGSTWTEKSEGLPQSNDTINCLLDANNYIFAGTSSNSVYRRPKSEVIGIQSISTEIPESFSLSQNYPNPFNPVTKIKFSIPNSTPLTPLQRGTVSLKVYDINGKEVAVLVNESLQPGIYEVTFDGSGLTSGVYFYKLQAGEFSVTKRMVMIK
jgi:hypothetical protein